MSARAAIARIAALVPCALALAAGGMARAEAPALPALDLDNPAPGVYVHYGQQALASPANHGDIANAGFVVGERCVAAIDTGGSYAVGRALREALRQVTPLPVCVVINTHGHPDHVLGNAAFAADGPELVGHARLAEALRRRGPHYVHALERDLGDAAAGSRVVLPTRLVRESETLDLGGRVLELRAWPTAHTDADLTVLDRASGTLWLGDLLFVGHVPVVDGSLRGYLGVLDTLAGIAATRVIPGHGRAGAWPAALDAERRYLERLRADVRGALRAQRTLGETLGRVREGSGEWLLFDAFHARNVTAAYAELEWDE